MSDADHVSPDEPGPLLESLRGVADQREFRRFAVLCCRRIWHRLSEPCRAAIAFAEVIGQGRADEAARKVVYAAAKVCCIYVDGDSTPDDRAVGFAAEAALCCVCNDNDYPTIPHYTTTCAIAAARAVVEVVIAESELRGEPESIWRNLAAQEEGWQHQLAQVLFAHHLARRNHG